MSTELGRIVEAVNTEKRHNLRLNTRPDPYGLATWSDHYAYAQRGIPIAFFFTGFHIDYHKLTDELQYINYPYLEKVAKYAYDLTLALGNRPVRPVVDRLPAKRPGR